MLKNLVLVGCALVCFGLAGCVPNPYYNPYYEEGYNYTDPYSGSSYYPSTPRNTTHVVYHESRPHHRPPMMHGPRHHHPDFRHHPHHRPPMMHGPRPHHGPHGNPMMHGPRPHRPPMMHNNNHHNPQPHGHPGHNRPGPRK